MITETAALDPAEFTTGRVELALDQLGIAIDVDGVDWGEADVAVQLARQPFGASVTDRHFEPVEMTIPLIVKEEGKVSLAEAAQLLEAKIGLLQREGGWVRRDFDDESGFAGSVGYQVLKASISGLQGWLFADQQIAEDVMIKILRSPFCYSTEEVESNVFKETEARELVFELAEVLGTAPGLIRVKVTNEGTEHWRACTLAMESRDHPQDASANTTAKLAYDAADLTLKGGAEVTGGVAPVVRGVGALASGTGSISPEKPAGYQAGDLLIMEAESGGATASTEANTALTASGWSSPPAPYADQKKGNTRLALLYRIATGTDPTATNDTGDHQAARIIAIKAGTFDPSAPFNVIAVGTQAASKAVSIPGGTTTRDRCLIIAFASGNLPDASTTTEFGAPTNASLVGLTELIDNTFTAGDGGALYAVSGIKEAKGAYSATTLTAITEAERGVISVAINPVRVVRHKELTAGWLSILNSKISGVGHMTHKGVRRIKVRAYAVGGEPGNVQFRLRWRALGTLQWSENSIVPTALVDAWQEFDLGEARPELAVIGAQRWEWDLQARAVNGSGVIDLHRGRCYPTEQFQTLSSPAVSQAADLQSQKAPGKVEDKEGVGTLKWSSPENAKSSDEARASLTFTAFTVAESHYLQASNFAFSIPEGATITGIGVSIEGLRSPAISMRDNIVRLVKSGSLVGDNAALPGYWATSEAVRQYGGSDDLWGTSWSPSLLNSSNFGVALSVAQEFGVGEATTGIVDQIRITVYYTEAPDENRVCFAARSAEFATDGVRRQHLEDDVWGPIVPIGSSAVVAPPSGAEARKMRMVVVPSAGDLGAQADAGVLPIRAQAFVRAAYLFAREAA